MKKILTFLMILVLTLTMMSCANNDKTEEIPIVNPTNLTFSLLDGEDDITMEGFTPIEDDAFIAEEGSTVLEATQLYCMSHDISISVDSKDGYVTEIAGFTQGDYSDMSEWVFTVNGERTMSSANEKIIEEGDKIAWEFIDFSAVAW